MKAFLLSVALSAALATAQIFPGDDENPCNLVDEDYTGDFDFDDYYDLDTMYDYIDFLSSKYRVKTETIGYSYNGVPMRLVKICDDDCGDRYGMWVDAGSHGNEWIGPAVAMYLIQELAANPEYRTLRYDLDWYILVSANPDGYAKSRSDGTTILRLLP